MIHFVGAGSGATDLITVRGAKHLSEADVIIYAGSLVNPELLNYAKEGCKIYTLETPAYTELLESSSMSWMSWALSMTLRREYLRSAELPALLKLNILFPE